MLQCNQSYDLQRQRLPTQKGADLREKNWLKDLRCAVRDKIIMLCWHWHHKLAGRNPDEWCIVHRSQFDRFGNLKKELSGG